MSLIVKWMSESTVLTVDDVMMSLLVWVQWLLLVMS
jgi:hypothetical protein